MSWLLSPAPGGQSPGLGWQPGWVSRAAWRGRAGLRAGGKLQSSLSRRPRTPPGRHRGAIYRPLCGLGFPGWCWEPAPGSFHAEGGACPHLSRPVPGCSSWPLQELATPSGKPSRPHLAPGTPGLRASEVYQTSVSTSLTDGRTDRASARPPELSTPASGDPHTADSHHSPELSLYQASVPPGGLRLPGFNQLCHSPQHLRPELGRGAGTGPPRPRPSPLPAHRAVPLTGLAGASPTPTSTPLLSWARPGGRLPLLSSEVLPTPPPGSPPPTPGLALDGSVRSGAGLAGPSWAEWWPASSPPAPKQDSCSTRARADSRGRPGPGLLVGSPALTGVRGRDGLGQHAVRHHVERAQAEDQAGHQEAEMEHVGHQRLARGGQGHGDWGAQGLRQEAP